MYTHSNMYVKTYETIYSTPYDHFLGSENQNTCYYVYFLIDFHIMSRSVFNKGVSDVDRYHGSKPHLPYMYIVLKYMVIRYLYILEVFQMFHVVIPNTGISTKNQTY